MVFTFHHLPPFFYLRSSSLKVTYFAKTIALKHKIPIETVQIMLGHTKITTTKEYADVDEEKVIDDTQGWEDKIDHKRAHFNAHRKNGTAKEQIQVKTA